MSKSALKKIEQAYKDQHQKLLDNSKTLSRENTSEENSYLSAISGSINVVL